LIYAVSVRQAWTGEERILRRIGVGLIGCGTVSLMGILPHLSQADAREKVEVIAVCDIVEARAQETAAKFGIRHHYTDAGELIGHDDVELVLVVTPIPHHHRYSMQALRAGKHVYVQKAMATTYAEAREMVEAASERNLVFAAAPGQMLAPAIRKMKELVDEGTLGKVYWAWGSTAAWDHEFESTRHGEGVLHSVDPSWYYQKGGGPLVDTTVYVLHSLTGILGPARRVAAMSGTRVPERHWGDKVIPVEVDDNTLLMLDFGEATFAIAGGNSSMTGQLVDWGSMGIYGSEGFVETLEIEPLSGHPAKLCIGCAHWSAEPLEISYGIFTQSNWLPYVNEAHTAIPEPHVYADIMDCTDSILEGRLPVASAEHAAHVVEIIEKGYLAARSGKTMELESSF
jgi:predicted dehydrogenase